MTNVAIYTREWSVNSNVVNGIAFDVAHLDKYILNYQPAYYYSLT